MSDPMPCPKCGARPSARATRCPTCGASTLRDVVVLLVEPKVAFQAARAVSALGPPAPAFAECRDRLARGGAVVAQVSPEFAARVVAALASSGVGATTVAGTSAPRPRWPMVAAALAAVVVGGTLWSASHRPRAAAPGVVAVPAPVVAAPVVDAGTQLTMKELSKRVTDRIAGIRCGEQLGSGFFIGRERLLSNAHVVCKTGPVSVVLADGRTLLGKVAKRDDWTDIAELDVFGADVEPLSIGDSTALEVGDPIVFVGSPRGLDFTVHEGKVSFVGRNLLGLAYVQINAAVNPGNSGGPMFNARGEVLGIVSMKATDADGIGFVLPLEYAREPVDPQALTRWRAILAHVAEDDRRAVKEEADALPVGKPRLLSVNQKGVGATAIVLERWADRPGSVSREFSLTTSSGNCGLKAQMIKWLPLIEAVHDLESRHLSWLVRHNLDQGQFVGIGVFENASCSAAQLTGDGRVAIRGRESDLFDLDARRVRPALGQAAPAPPLQRPLPEAARVDTGAEEGMWRARFQAARQRIAQVDARVKAAQARIQQMDQAVMNGSELTPAGRVEYFRLKDMVARKDDEARAADEALHELERQAANAAVPFPWRQ